MKDKVRPVAIVGKNPIASQCEQCHKFHMGPLVARIVAYADGDVRLQLGIACQEGNVAHEIDNVSLKDIPLVNEEGDRVGEIALTQIVRMPEVKQ